MVLSVSLPCQMVMKICGFLSNTKCQQQWNSGYANSWSHLSSCCTMQPKIRNQDVDPSPTQPPLICQFQRTMSFEESCQMTAEIIELCLARVPNTQTLTSFLLHWGLGLCPSWETLLGWDSSNRSSPRGSSFWKLVLVLNLLLWLSASRKHHSPPLTCLYLWLSLSAESAPSSGDIFSPWENGSPEVAVFLPKINLLFYSTPLQPTPGIRGLSRV